MAAFFRPLAKRSRGSRGTAALLAALLAAGVVAATAPPASAAPIPGNRTFAWGSNTNGQLGDGTNVEHPLPVQTLLPPGTTVTALAGGNGFSLALDSIGRVWSWGDNAQGQLGIDVTGAPVFTPQLVHIPLGTTITAISTDASASFALALTSDGRVLAWGRNDVGQTGSGLAGGTRPTPVQALIPLPVRAIGTGGDHGLAVDTTGQVWTWGDNAIGQLGNGTTGGFFATPALVPSLVGTTVTEVAGGATFSLARTATGEIRGWGSNGEGQLGLGVFGGVFNTAQTTIGLPAPVTRIAAGAYHSLAITAAGEALSWGYNLDGELGDNSTVSRATPGPVLVPPGTTVIAIIGGAFHSLALTSAHQVLAWGDNGNGELGNGSTGFGEISTVPIFSQIPGGVSIGGIAAGAFDSFAFTVTTTTLTASPASPEAGTPVTLTATVDCGQTAPSGQVEFFEGAALVGTGTLSGTPGTTSVTLTSLSVGPHTFTAVYDGNGDGTCPTSDANSVTVTVAQATSTTTLAAVPINPAFGQPVTLTATVDCAAGPTGQVRFLEGSTVIGTGTLSGSGPSRTADTTVSGSTVGPHTFTAQYLGDTNCGGSTSAPLTITVAQTSSTTTLTSTPVNPGFGQPVTLTATVVCAGGPTGQVRFLEGTTLLGTAPLTGTGTTRTASLTLPGLAPGPHTFTAQYSGNANCAASSGNTPVVTVGCARTISTTVAGNVVVTAPTCVTATGRITGSVLISGAGSLALQGGQVLGAVVANGGTGLLMCGSSVFGPVTVTRMTGVVVVGDAGDDGAPACPGNTIAGPVFITGTVGFVEVSGNRIAGGLSVFGNTTTILVPPENAPATELESNDIGGNLACGGNTPPPGNNGRPNRVRGVRTGQCAGL